MARCTICEKTARSGSAVSHSQIHTKRRFKPNLQKVNGLILCTKCLKTIKTIQRENAASEKVPAEIVELEEVKVAESEPVAS
jgi:ribosomal protein L28